MKKTSTDCPCCSGQSYQHCCQSLIDNRAFAKTPEQLMRSRYTAFTQANMDYLQRTMQGPAAQRFDIHSARDWARSVQWKKLVVVESSEDGDRGFVKFQAYFINQKGLQCMTEHSIFQRMDGQWYYVDMSDK